MKTKYIIHKTNVFGEVSAESHDDYETTDKRFNELSGDKNILFVRVVSRTILNESRKGESE